MRLDELVGFKSKPENVELQKSLGNMIPDDWHPSQVMHLSKFMSFLKSKGFAKLGNGAFALVFTHPNLDYCIKIYRCDKGYDTFVQYCMTNKANCLPKFRGKIVKIDKNTRAVRMENLTPVPNNGSWFLIALHTVEFAESNLTLESYISEVSRRADQGAKLAIEYFQSHPDLASTLENLSKLKNANNLEYDLGVNNLMIRDNKTLVITDPFV
jgi:hypothetical protein